MHKRMLRSSNFHVQDLRAPLFGKHSSELLDPKAYTKYCSAQLFENVLSELKAPGPGADILSIACKDRKGITEGLAKSLTVSS